MTGPQEIWPEGLRTLESGKRFALATVVNVRGSTPREVGAKMIVSEDGQFGTIGGGCGEAEVFRKARLALESDEEARLAEVDLTGDFEQQEIGVCGGIMDVFIDLWLPQRDLELARKLADASKQNRPAALLTVVAADTGRSVQCGARAVIEGNSAAADELPVELGQSAVARLVAWTQEAKPALFEADRGDVRGLVRIEPGQSPQLFLDPVAGAQRLIIAGAGHIAQPLASFASALGFHVTVIDDRAAFANRERFPTANEIVVRSFAEAIAALKLDRYCYLVSITRGHAYDEEVVRTALARADGSFIGMIGSRRRVRTTLERLEREGFARGLLNQVHAPLGLAIGAETPEEIALSIIAEIVRERRTGVRDEFSLGVKLGRLSRERTLSPPNGDGQPAVASALSTR